jgi:predicted metal-dependent phosphoesterase TrpH
MGMAFIAICDHDTVNGLAAALEAAKSFPQLKVIPGIEIRTRPARKVRSMALCQLSVRSVMGS